jgi:hypothetical protein
MKTAKKFFVFGVLVSMFLSSCTMQKCVYSKGYYVDWFGKSGNDKKEIDKDENNVTRDVAVKQEASESESNISSCTEANSQSNNTELSANLNEELLVLDEKKNLFKRTNDEIQKDALAATFKSEFKQGASMIVNAPDDSQKTNGMAIAGFVCSLVGLFLFGIVLGLLGIIFGAIGLGKISKDSSRWKGKGMAIAALIVGVVDVVVAIILLALIL